MPLEKVQECLGPHVVMALTDEVPWLVRSRHNPRDQQGTARSQTYVADS